MRPTYTLFALFALFALFLACTRPQPVEHADIARAAVRQLFLTRERAQAITLWRDQTVSLSFRGALTRLDLDSATLALPVPTADATTASMERFFRDHPSGWDAWFKAHPANAGLIEIAEPRVDHNDATIVIGRACGEHCRNVWRVTLQRLRHEWVVQRIDVLPASES